MDSPKGSRVKPRSPKQAQQRWSIRFASARAKGEWHDAMADEPEIMSGEKDRLHARPLDRGDNPRRTHPLKGSRAYVNILGEKFPVWQREPTSAGRIWYAADKKSHTIWITKVTLSHPKENE